MTYIVTAYRWGWLNGHQYIVYCGNDLERAEELAEEENNDRGGKYGLSVDQYDDHVGDHIGRLQYYPSSLCEKRPEHNYRMDYLQHLGHMMEDYVEGNMWIAEEGSTVLERQPIDPDPRLVKRAADRKQFYDKMQELSNESRT